MKKILTILFSILYLSVGFVSVYHAINFFTISNENWLAIILAIAFEIGHVRPHNPRLYPKHSLIY